MRDNIPTNLRKLKKISWYKEGGAMAPFFILYPYGAQFRGIKSPGIFWSKNLVGSGYYDKAGMKKEASRVFRAQMENAKYIDGIIRNWEKRFVALERAFSSLPDTNLSKMSDQKLRAYFKRFNRYLIKMWNAGPHLLEVFNEYDTYFLDQLLGTNKFDSKKIQVLTTPTTPSFHLVSQKEFLKLLRVYKNNPEKTKRHIRDYAKKYFWLKNNWAYVHHLDEEFFLKQLKTADEKKIHLEIRNPEKHLRTVGKEQKSHLRSMAGERKLKNYLYFLRRLGTWREDRKAVSLKTIGWKDIFLREFSRRSGVTYEHLKYCNPYYFERSFRLPSSLIQNLKEHNALNIIWGHNDFEVYFGRQADYVGNEIESCILAPDKNKISGKVAQSGIATGKVRLIFTYKDFKKMRKGDIIVTQMTRPDFMPVIHKAAAIVTDEGGITCHAAIVSRELGIPCVIATQVATKVLKDGDRVEVDASSGVVRKLS